ncbi:hypothetical protein K505DRAFT_420998 [Melanomma pulvis-pyrius CBS 109.77]|uniref:Uncharacterized protein n=1 Tax=Melanomma pulvis-pyrius CBS 109.77 TaxID=1314802 RepID=A0A6A6WWM0_9PLEO|nr:hypothetical protein K505DRAFT_420998 [Melanomma pulvis-pyrius CBS 109.77]
MSSPNDKSLLTRTGDTLFTFVALYFTTLFSMDTWDAARGSPYRAPGTNTFYRPAHPTPSSDSYQGAMRGLGPPRGNGGGGGARGVGRLPGAVDSRPPMRMGGTAGCGACMI